MLVQHLLTERIFRTVFGNPDFAHRNVIAGEIEKVIDALTSKSFSRADFLKSLDRFYGAIERTAAAIGDFSQKQHFLNTVYEQFFQGFSVEVADTHGVVYTPQPIVDFMARSVEELLRTEFGRSLSAPGVHVIDPFVGTGNFMVRVMREIRKTALEEKYANELHCNEVMLLPYYIASMNIEREFYEATGSYRPFGGLCLVDTFELAEERQRPLFAEENAARVERQKAAPMFVVIGNPPYNMGQVNENDNNRNRRYETMDARVKETYARDSQATLKNKLYDPYVKAIRWASDRIGEEGVVAFVTNNGFLDGLAFDGMRKHLAGDFNAIYVLDLGGNARKELKVSDSNVFGIRVGVSVSFFVKRKGKPSEKARIFYHRTDDLWTKKQKFDFLNERRHSGNVAWRPLTPDERHTWFTEGLRPEFAAFTPLGTKEAKAAKGEAAEAIFKTYSLGVTTNRDAWACNFDRGALAGNMSRMIAFYNEQTLKWERREDRDANVDHFVASDDRKIKWTDVLKKELRNGKTVDFSECKVREFHYRPFTKTNLYFDRVMNQRVYVFPSIFPTPETEAENRVICVSGPGSNKPLSCLDDKGDSVSSPHRKYAVLPFLRLRRGRNGTPGERYRLGAGALPRALCGRRHHEARRLPLRLWASASPGLAGALSGEPQARPAAPPLRPGLPRVLGGGAPAGGNSHGLRGYGGASPRLRRKAGRAARLARGEDAALEGRDEHPLQRFSRPRGSSAGGVSVSARQPLRARMGDRPIPGEDGQAKRHRQRPEPEGRPEAYRPARREGHRRKPRDRENRPGPAGSGRRGAGLRGRAARKSGLIRRVMIARVIAEWRRGRDNPSSDP